MAGHGPSERSLDPGIRLVLEELRDLRLEMRADRQRADEERRQDRQLSDLRFEKSMRQSDQRFERAMLESREWFDEAVRASDGRLDKAMRASDERLDKAMRASDERFDKAMRDTQRAFRDVRTVGLSIVKTLNRHTRILERIERRLGAPGPWRPGQGNGRGGAHR